MGVAEVARFYGSHSTKSGIMKHFYKDLIPNVRLLKLAAQHNRDPKDCILVEGVRTGQACKGQSEPSHMSNTQHISLLRT